MFIDARQVTGGAPIQADIAIVGAGAAGITLALELMGSGRNVCLLESGGTELDWASQALYRGRSVGLPHCALDVCQLRYLGGNTNAWGGWCRPLEAIDFEPRDWIPYSGWPFRADALEPFYRRAHELCQVTSDEYGLNAALAELRHPRAKVLPFDPSRLQTLIYRFSPPTRFGQTYRAQLKRASDVSCYLHANVLGIESNPDARAVTRLRVGTLSGARFEVEAQEFVLAAGGIENARLLLLSNDVVAGGLGNQNDLVGRFFMDHPHTRRQVLVPSKRMQSGLYGELFRRRRIIARAAMSESVQRDEGLLNYSANLHAIYFGYESKGWVALRDSLQSLSRQRRSDPYLRSPPFERKGLSFRQLLDVTRELDRAAAAGFLRIFQPDGFVCNFVLESKPEQAPNRDSRVSLDDECDAFGLNRIKVDWRTLPIDRRTAVRGEELVDAELRRLGIGSLAPLKPAEVEGWPANLESGWHQLGTTRMHADPKQGVVDANGRVHGTTNLFIAGGSLFPTGGTAPPTLTVVALALRLATHLRQRSVKGSERGNRL